MVDVNPTEEEIAEALEGSGIGKENGVVICGSCSDRLQAENKPRMTAHARTPSNRNDLWKIREVYCMDCEEREIGTPTDYIDEAMIEFTAEPTPGLSVVRDVEIIDRSELGEGQPA